MSNSFSESGLGSERKTVYTVSTTLEASNGTSRHKATVVIEPPVPKPSQTNQAVYFEDDYAAKPSHSAPMSSVQLLPEVLSPTTLAVSPSTPKGAQETAATESTNQPNFVVSPVPFSFELASPVASETTVTAPILPFSTTRVIVQSTEVPKSANTAEFQADEQFLLEEETPGRPEPAHEVEDKHAQSASQAIPVPSGSALGYSSAKRGPETRTTGASPPDLSYSQSTASPSSTSLAVSTNPSLSYSQATSGVAFAQSGSDPQKDTKFHAQPYAGPAYGSGSVHISGIPSYASPASNSAH